MQGATLCMVFLEYTQHLRGQTRDHFSYEDMMELEILYYGNGRGGVALSVDGGEHVVLANGRALYAGHTIWTEVGEDLEDQLSTEQTKALQEARDAYANMDEMGELVETFRLRKIHEEKVHPRYKDNTPHRKVRDSALVLNSDWND